ncbi:MAG: N-acetylmuramoyl-L-alanine amidase [Roseburia sp.]|nr:N-acetylmuramoyl-L-alanine amidase [Roseburia sp.]
MTAVFCSLLSFCLSVTACFMACHSLSAFAAPCLQQTDTPVVIVIDPGHGGENQGTTENGFQEKAMTMTTALAMYEELLAYDNVEVYMTHTEDIDMSLKERAEFAQGVGADFLFSIHYNASVEHVLFGSEVWISCQTPYHAYGYQFGYVHQLLMQDMGLFSRGIKTRIDDKEDYYGIIRESVARKIPAVIIEHCHVDESRDAQYCSDEEKLKAFGRADALAVAQYFGLKSQALGVDYSQSRELPDVAENVLVQAALKDETPPDVCLIEIAKVAPEEGVLTLNVTAADYDSPLIYYSYSLDGGNTYSPLQPWPESNALTGAYKDTFLLELEVPEGMRPDVTLRAYQLFDAYTESNMINFPQIFGMPKQASEDASREVREEEEPLEEPLEMSKDAEPSAENIKTFRPVMASKPEETDGQISFWSFLELCLFLVIFLFATVLLYQALRSRSHRKRHRKR